MVTLSVVRGPADAWRYTSSKISVVRLRRAEPRPHSMGSASMRQMQWKDVRAGGRFERQCG